jgi:hypothetical protein
LIGLCSSKQEPYFLQGIQNVLLSCSKISLKACSYEITKFQNPISQQQASSKLSHIQKE